MSTNSTSTDEVLGVEVTHERDTDHGWSFDVEVSWKGLGVSEHEVTLSWVDHNAICGGSEAPSSLIARLVEEYASVIGRVDMPELADVSTLRRLVARLSH